MKYVGEQFGIEKYSTVSSIVERVKNEMKTEMGLKNRMQNLAEKKPRVNGRFDPLNSKGEM